MTGIVIFSILLSSAMPTVTYQTALDFYVFNSAIMILNAALGKLIFCTHAKIRSIMTLKVK